MTAILSKMGRVSTNMLSSADPPSNEEFVRILDYEDLERRFQIHKYYPRFIHNYDYSTPQIRLMIGDKPVYSKANEHLKSFKNPGTRKTYITEIDVETGEVRIREKLDKKTRKEEKKKKREIRREAKDELKPLKKEQREEHRALKAELREDENVDKNTLRDELRAHRKDLKDERREEKEDYRHLLREHREQRKESRHSSAVAYVAPAIQLPAAAHCQRQKLKSESKDDLVFNNPFGTEQATLVPSQQLPKIGLRSR